MSDTGKGSRAHALLVPGPARLLHGGDYNPEQWLHRPDLLEEDARLMREAGVNEATVAIFAWAALEPEPDRFEFGWLDGTLDRLHGTGVGVILATPTAARPRWLAEAHPEVMQTTSGGQRLSPAFGRHNACWSSVYLRERSALIVDRMAERYAKHPALLGWHIGNEFGGSVDDARCHCEACVEGFRAWLKGRYGNDLARLNRAWWTGFWSHQYQAWEQIRPGDGSIEALGLNWQRFGSAQVADTCAREVAAIRRHSAAPVTTNMHGGLDQYDHGKLARMLDFTSYDSYPELRGGPADRDELHRHAWRAAATRGFGGGKPWLLMESCPSVPQWQGSQRLKRPGTHRLLSLGMVAEGSDGVCYFQWRAGRGGMEKLHGAVLMQDSPHDSRVFREVAALGRELAGLSGLAGAAIPSSAAVVWDVESEWARRLNSGLNSIPTPRDEATAWHRPFWEAGIGADVVDAMCDLTSCRLVVVPGLFLLGPGFAGRLEAAARAGALVLIDGLSAWVDEDLGCVDGGRPGPLREALGLRCEEFDQLGAGEAVAVRDPEGWLGDDARVTGWADRVHVEGAEVLAVMEGGFHDGWPLLTRRRLGVGGASTTTGAAGARASGASTTTGACVGARSGARGGAYYYLAGGLGVAQRGSLIGRLCAEAGIAPCLPGLPPGIIARERRQPGRRHVFLLNPGEAAARVPLGAEWKGLAGEALAGSIGLGPREAIIVVAEGP